LLLRVKVDAMRRFAVLALALWSSVALADWRGDVPSAQLVGEGDFSWFGIRLYHAQLWSERVPVNYDARFALQISYARTIRREKLVNSGIDEIRRVSSPPVPADTLERWRADMLQAFVDVTSGDRLSAVFCARQGRALLRGRPHDRRVRRSRIRAGVLQHLARSVDARPSAASRTAWASSIVGAVWF
jgi:hypothetical protein